MWLSDHARHWAVPVALVTVFGLGACASSERPTQELASARSAISRAQADGAGQLAPAPLQSAQDKFARAHGASDDAEARRLAQASEVDADLAAATARAQRAEATFTDLTDARGNLRQRGIPPQSQSPSGTR
jgi:hypothetical protein